MPDDDRAALQDGLRLTAVALASAQISCVRAFLHLVDELGITA